MRTYFSRWKQPTKRDIAALVLFSALVVLGVVWTFNEVQKHSQEAKKAKYETCIHEAEAKHVLPLPSLDEIQACKQRAGVK